jgi:hypothetical protein
VEVAHSAAQIAGHHRIESNEQMAELEKMCRKHAHELDPVVSDKPMKVD